MTRKPWIKPEVQTEKLTASELAALRSADNPMAELIKLKPDLVGGRPRKSTDPE